MKKIILFAFILLGGIHAQGQERKSTILEADTARWVKHVETKMDYWRRFGYEPLNKIKASAMYMQPTKMIPELPLAVSIDYGYVNEHTVLLGVGTAFGNKELFFSPQAFIAAGYQDGIGIGWIFDVEKGKFLFHNKTVYITDYRAAKDAIFSNAEITCRPIHGFGFGAEVQTNIDLNRNQGEMPYKPGGTVTAETSVFLRGYLDHYSSYLQLSGGIEPTRLRENLLSDSWFLQLTAGWSFSWPTKKKK